MTTATHRRTGFLRPFLGGFALGAAALVGVQVADRGHAETVRSAPIERVG